jgi:hypothetical protein
MAAGTAVDNSFALGRTEIAFVHEQLKMPFFAKRQEASTGSFGVGDATDTFPPAHG